MQQHDISFWVAVAGATLIKLTTSPYTGPFKAGSMVVAAIISAYLFTAPALAFFNLDPDTYTTPMAALLALTGEGIARWLIGLSQNLPTEPSKIAEFIRSWRGGK